MPNSSSKGKVFVSDEQQHAVGVSKTINHSREDSNPQQTSFHRQFSEYQNMHGQSVPVSGQAAQRSNLQRQGESYASEQARFAQQFSNMSVHHPPT